MTDFIIVYYFCFFIALAIFDIKFGHEFFRLYTISVFAFPLMSGQKNNRLILDRTNRLYSFFMPFSFSCVALRKRLFHPLFHPAEYIFIDLLPVLFIEHFMTVVFIQFQGYVPDPGLLIPPVDFFYRFPELSYRVLAS